MFLAEDHVLGMIRALKVPIQNIFEILYRHSFQFINGGPTDQYQIHQVAGVVSFIEKLQLIQDAIDVERFLIACPKAIQQWTWYRNVIQHDLIESAVLRTQPQLILIVNCIYLSLGSTGREQWLLEKPAEYVKNLLEFVIFNLEVIVSVVTARGRIVAATVLGQ